MAKIVITGGTGLVGSYLSKMLSKNNHEVVHLSRTPDSSAEYPTFEWNIGKKYIDPNALDGADYVIHLAGAGVANKRWTKQRKKVIIDSRVESIKLLKSQIEKQQVKLKSFISASAIGYYGMDTGAAELTEESKPGNDYLAHVVKLWEAEADTLEEFTSVAKVRVGVVLAKEGGALKEIAKPVKLFAGAPLGSGDQYMSWIHIYDLCAIFRQVLENKLEGTYNATAPNPVTNEALTKSLAKALKRPLILPNVPAFVMKSMLGEMAQMVLGGNYVLSDKIQSTGFTYKFTQVDAAVKDILC
ncbi:TIGR01777 family oxidoreductase [Marinoscillum pacificum]|uniref:TIGR01777 family oxidoreductase n=1 Tax=Marinoscillum pacificum TaxID=392723 RepID=UPI002156FEC7|nr:TIGR01777 family oxidoreductase [Marinoscillum pacificum]